MEPPTAPKSEKEGGREGGRERASERERIWRKPSEDNNRHRRFDESVKYTEWGRLSRVRVAPSARW